MTHSERKMISQPAKILEGAFRPVCEVTIVVGWKQHWIGLIFWVKELSHESPQKPDVSRKELVP